MAVEYIRYALKDREPQALVAAYETAARHLASSPECISYELSQCVDDVTCFVLRIEWTSVAAHMEQFRKGEHFPPFLAAIRDFIPEIAEMRHYEITSCTGLGAASKQ